MAGFSEVYIQIAARSAAEAAKVELPDNWSTTDLSGVSHELLQILVNKSTVSREHSKRLRHRSSKNLQTWTAQYAWRVGPPGLELNKKAAR